MYSFTIEMADILVALLQGYVLAWMLGSFLETKLRNRYGSRFYAVFFWTFLKLGIQTQSADSYSGIRSLLKLTMLSVFLFLFVVLFYQGERIFQFYITTVFMALSEISFLIAYMIIVLGNHIFDLYLWYMSRGQVTEQSLTAFCRLINATEVTLLCSEQTAFLLILWLSVKSLVGRYREKEYTIKKTEHLFLIAPAMCGLFICALLRVIIVTMEDGVPTILFDRYPLFIFIIPAIQLLSLVSILSSVQLFQDMVALGREKSGRLIMEQQIRSLQEHIQVMNRTYAGIRSIRHDMRNQLAVVRELMRQTGRGGGGEQELETYMEALERTADSLEPKFKTGNIIADAIINLKYQEAAAAMPDVDIDADELIFPADSGIENYDIAVILCNGLDNAIEACKKLGEEQEKRISLFSFQRGSFFFLKIENSFDGRLQCRRDREFPATDKSEKRLHGIGFLNMKAAAGKYCGSVDWKAENGTFYLTVMMKDMKAGKGTFVH
ncbi:GHKL domain-containing protein [Lachnospiraceae bacterium JLR.KK008]